MARANNFPTGQLNEVPAEFVKNTVSSLRQLSEQGKPESDEELANRISEYFKFCETSSIRPGVESLAVALSTTRTTLWNWEHGIGCSSRRQELISKAKAFITAYIEQSLLSSRIFPATGIFLLKNWANYRDSVSVEPVENNSIYPTMSKEEIAARHASYIGMEEPEKPDLDFQYQNKPL